MAGVSTGEASPPPPGRMGRVITCMSSVLGHKSTEVQVDDESPPVAVLQDLQPHTSTLLPVKYPENSPSRWSRTERAAGFMKGNSCSVLFQFYYSFQGKVSRSSAWWELDTGSDDNIWMWFQRDGSEIWKLKQGERQTWKILLLLAAINKSEVHNLSARNTWSQVWVLLIPRRCKTLFSSVLIKLF